MSREVMQMALDMLNEIADDVYCDQKLEGVITALRQALVDDVNTSQDHVDETVKCKHEWVGLTDDVVFELADTNLYEGGKNYGVLAFAKAVEQALKEKNK
jgi:hypothetical protein